MSSLDRGKTSQILQTMNILELTLQSLSTQVAIPSSSETIPQYQDKDEIISKFKHLQSLLFDSEKQMNHDFDVFSKSTASSTSNSPLPLDFPPPNIHGNAHPMSMSSLAESTNSEENLQPIITPKSSVNSPSKRNMFSMTGPPRISTTGEQRGRAGMNPLQKS